METFAHLRRARAVLLSCYDRDDGRVLHRRVKLAVEPNGQGAVAPSGRGMVAVPRRMALLIDASPDVRVGSCNWRGRPDGSDQPAVATRLTAAEDVAAARRALRRRFPLWGPAVSLWARAQPNGLGVGRFGGIGWLGGVGWLAVEPADEPTPWASAGG